VRGGPLRAAGETAMNSIYRSILARSLMTGVASLAFMTMGAAGVRAEIVTVQGDDGKTRGPQSRGENQAGEGGMTTMDDLTASTNATLPGLIEKAAAALATATTAAEVLDAKNKAGSAYTTAKAAARFAEAKNAHDAIVAACRKAMGDALIIQATAQCRLADEYDAAQERGEIAKQGQQDRARDNVRNGNIIQTTAEIGLTRKQVHEARTIRDAEKMQPGIVRETVEGKLKAGRGPTLADVKHAAIRETHQRHTYGERNLAERDGRGLHFRRDLAQSPQSLGVA
jgi:hypothetical protein